MVPTIHRWGARTVGSLRRLQRPLLYTGAGLAAALVVLAALLVGLRLARPGALPGVTVAGVDVGGLGGAELDAAITRAGHGDLVVTVTAGDDEVRATAPEIGYRLDVVATRERVLERGRQANPLAALIDHLRAIGGRPTAVALAHDVDGTDLDRWVAEVAGTLTQPRVEGTVVFASTTVERVDPVPGVTVDAEALRRRTLAALLGDGEATFAAPGERTRPRTSAADVDALAEQAERALSAPVVLRRGGAALRVSPEQMAEMLLVRRDGGELSLELHAGRLAAMVGHDLRQRFEHDPVDARFEIEGDSVSVVPSRDGFRFDPEAAAEQLLAVATGEGRRLAPLRGERVEPELTTAEAEALEIVEQVSTFTTHHACCQSRVTNIHRIADIVDGVVIRPGETLSINDHVGRRTVAKGFVGGGAIQNGEFVTEIGGGVSQFATTMYNAAFFGGYQIPESKTHSYYISRYPVGREATLNYPDVDLAVHNNSPYGILVDTSYTGTSITVTLWGKRWVEVGDITGEPFNVRQAPVQRRENPALPPGTERVVQSGRQGFDIVVVRILTFPDGREEREEIFTRYLPEPRIVEFGPEPPEEPEGGEEAGDGG